MKVRFEVESAQIGMPEPDLLRVRLNDNSFVEVEKLGGGWKRLSVADFKDIWQRYQRAQELIRIKTSS